MVLLFSNMGDNLTNTSSIQELESFRESCNAASDLYSWSLKTVIKE